MRFQRRFVVFLILALAPLAALHGAQDRWTTQGPYGGRVDSAAVSPATPSLVYASAHRSVYRSGNAGQNWEEAGAGLYGMDTGRLRISAHPARPGYLLVAGGRSVFASQDGGRNWYRSDEGLPLSPTFKTLDVHFAPSQPERAYLATQQGLFRSENGGASWSVAGASNIPPRLQRVAVDPNDANQILVWSDLRNITGFPASLYRSVDGGNSFTPVSGPWNTEGPILDPLALLAYNGNTPGSVFLAGSFGNFRSTDGGSNFIALPALPMGAEQRLQAMDFDPDQTGRVMFGTSRGVLLSPDNGASFLPRNNGLAVSGPLPASIGSLVSQPGIPQRLLAFSLSGDVYASFDAGANWGPSSTGLVGTPVTALAVHPLQDNIVFSGIANVLEDTVSPALFQSLDSAQSWQAANAQLALDSINRIHFDPASINTVASSVVFASGRDFAPLGLAPEAYRGGLFRSSNGGLNWAPADNFNLPSGALPAELGDVWDVAFIGNVVGGATQTLAVSVDGRGVCDPFSGFNLQLARLWFSDDGGNSFVARDLLPPGACVAGIPVYPVPRVLLAVPDQNLLFAGTALTNLCELCTGAALVNGVFRSTNNGQTWAQVSNGLPTLPSGTVFDVAALVQGQPGELLVAVNRPGDGLARGRVFRSPNNGASWEPFDTGLGGRSVRALLVDDEQGRYFAALDGSATNPGGVYVRPFGGTRWFSINVGLPPHTASALALSQPLSGPPTLHVATERGVWSLTKGVDVDFDGPSDAEEDLAPNNGDGNADGIPDRLQADVASILLGSPAPESAGLPRGSLARGTIGNINLLRGDDQECSQILDAHQPELDSLRADTGFAYPAGVLQFEFLGCEEALVEIILHDNDPGPDAVFRRFGPEEVGNPLSVRWLAMDDDAQWVNGRWLLQLSDNSPGDFRSEEGRFMFIGGPAIPDSIFANGFEAQ